jgi:hypothetical protein
MARLACVPSELGSAADYPKETIIPQKPPPDEARSFGCLSSIILSPLNGNVKMSPYETGDIHVATTGSGVMALRFGRIPEEDGSDDAAPGGADRLFSPPLCSRCCIAFSNSFW